MLNSAIYKKRMDLQVSNNIDGACLLKSVLSRSYFVVILDKNLGSISKSPKGSGTPSARNVFIVNHMSTCETSSKFAEYLRSIVGLFKEGGAESD
jgi:hypothetical protein